MHSVNDDFLEASNQPMLVFSTSDRIVRNANRAAVLFFRTPLNVLINSSIETVMRDQFPMFDALQTSQYSPNEFQLADVSIEGQTAKLLTILRHGSLEPNDLVSLSAQSKNAGDPDATAQRLKLSEERFRLVAEATDDVLWDCDLKSGQMWWNERLLEVFGHDASQFKDKMNWWDSNLHPEEAEAVLHEMQAILDSAETSWKLKYRFKRADGSYAHVIDRGSILRDADGVAVRILGSMTDISEQLDVEEKLRQSQKLEAIGKLTGGIAHDFNNLLAIIMGNLELLSDDLLERNHLSDDLKELIDASVSAVNRGADLTNQMLSYARKAKLHPLDLNLNERVHQTVSWIRRTLPANVEIDVKLAHGLPDIHVDPNSLQNAIINLLLNARDALDAGGRIEIETRMLLPGDAGVPPNLARQSKDGFVVLSIQDNGQGIASVNLQNVFDPFFTTKPVGSGSGLGLSMVQGFVRQSGGDIRVSSQVGIGTHVEIFFRACKPLTDLNPERVAQRSISSTLRSESAGPRRRVLVVDDDFDVRRMLERMLKMDNFEVVSVATGDAALDFFKRDKKFDLILTDMSMPGHLQGDALALACRELSAGIPIIFLSGHPITAHAEVVPRLPNSVPLMKPLTQKRLLAAVWDMVGV